MKYSLTTALPVLERTPSVLRVLLSGLPEAWIRSNEGRDSWSPYDVLGHLIHGEKTDWIPRAKIILNEGESRAFEPFDRFAQFRESAGKTLDQLLGEFEIVRSESLKELRALNPGEDLLHKTGTHPAFGRVTLGNLLACWVAHDLGHIAQVSRVMAKQYRNEVGPWRAYLPVLG